MLTREELRVCLEKAQFSEEQIELIFSKKIDTLLSRRSDTIEISKVLKVLEEHRVSKDAIVNCLTLLTRGNAKKIEAVFEVLDNKVSKEAIENCLLVLLSNANEVEKVYKTLIDHKISVTAIENCLYVLARGKADEIEDILTILDGKIDIKAIENCLSLLASGRADEIKEIFKVLEEHTISYEAIGKCLSVLKGGKKGEQAGKRAQEIDEILGILEKRVSKEAIENCLTILLEGKADTIRAILKVLDEHKISNEAIENCLSVFIQKKDKNRADEIDKILGILEDNKISKRAIENCLSVLGRGSSKEIKAIFKVLKKHEIGKATIERCLYVLAVGKAKEIDDILALLKENGISQASIERCLTILSDGTVKRIKDIFAVLDRHKLNKKIVEGSLSVLAKENPEKVEAIIVILEENGVSKEAIELGLTPIITARMSVNDVKAMFDDSKGPKNKQEHFNNVRRYMRLKEMYGKFYTNEEVEQFCKQKHISVEEFITEVVAYPTGKAFLPIYYQKLKTEGNIYVGGSTFIDREYLEEHGEELIGLAKKAAFKFANKTGYHDTAELESRAVEAITERCGNLVNNLKNYQYELQVCIINKTMGCLNSVLHENNLQAALTELSEKGSEGNGRPVEEKQIGQLRNSIDYEKAEFNKIETEVMDHMIRLVEEGEADNLYEKIAEIVIIDVEMVATIVQQIRQKMIQKKLVRQRAGGGYEFAD